MARICGSRLANSPARHLELPLQLELSSAAGRWLNDGNVWVGIVQGRDLVRLEEAERRPRPVLRDACAARSGWKGGRDGETVNQAIRSSVVEAEGEMLARNNGVTFRASEVEPLSDGTL